MSSTGVDILLFCYRNCDIAVGIWSTY